MPRRSHKHEELGERSRRLLLKEYDALPRDRAGHVVSRFTSLLARKWGLSAPGMLNMVRKLREEHTCQAQSSV